MLFTHSCGQDAGRQSATVTPGCQNPLRQPAIIWGTDRAELQIGRGDVGSCRKPIGGWLAACGSFSVAPTAV